MKLLIQSAMIFFGTLMAAGIVALGEPASPGVVMVADSSHSSHSHAATMLVRPRAAPREHAGERTQP